MTDDRFHTDLLSRYRSPAEFLLLRERIVREARTAQAAAVGAALVRTLAAGWHWIRLLSSVMTEALALRDAVTPALQRRRPSGPTHYQ